MAGAPHPNIFGAYYDLDPQVSLSRAQAFLIEKVGGRPTGLLRAVILSQREVHQSTGGHPATCAGQRRAHLRRDLEAEAAPLASRPNTGLLVNQVVRIDHPSHPQLDYRFFGVETRSTLGRQPAEQLRRAARLVMEGIAGASHLSAPPSTVIRHPFIPLVLCETESVDRDQLRVLTDELVVQALPAIEFKGDLGFVEGIQAWD